MNAALVLQQIHYWMPMATKHYDGHKWVYKTYADFSDELGITGAQSRRAVGMLRDHDLLIARPNPEWALDQTLWFRIDYEALEDLIKSSRLNESADGLSAEADGLPSGGVDLTPEPEELASGALQYQEITNREDQQEITSLAAVDHLQGDEEGDSFPPDEDWYVLLTLFVNFMAKFGIGKPEYIEEDISKSAWQTEFQVGVEQYGAAAVEGALTSLVDRLEQPRLDPGADWRTILRGPKSAQAFIRRIPQLLASTNSADDEKRYGQWA